MYIYNEVNLPLSGRKIAKKTIATAMASLFFLIILGLIAGLSAFALSVSILASIFIGIGVGISPIIIFSIYQYYYFKMYRYEFRPDSADISKGVISRATGHVRYERLQNVYVDQDLLDRMFGLYDVHYETAGASSGFYSHVDGLEKNEADKLVQFLHDKLLIGKTTSSSDVHKLTEETTLEQNSPSAETISSENIKIEKAAVAVKTLYGIIASTFFILVFLLYFFRFKILIEPVVITLILVPFVAIGARILASIWYKNFYFDFQPTKGEIRSKVITSYSAYVYYDRIQNIDIRQGILDRFYNIYAVIIETAGGRGGQIKLYGYNKESADKLREFLLHKAKTYRGGGL